MIWNIIIDLVVGLVPLFGDVLDAWLKANMRNATLLLHHLQATHQSPGNGGWILWLEKNSLWNTPTSHVENGSSMHS